MKPERPGKKSETVKFRAPWTLKRDFMAKARREGRSASDIFREAMEDYLRRPAQRTATQKLETAMTAIRRRPRTGFAAVLGAAGLSALIAGALPAGAASDLRAEFEALDANGDGALTMQELEGSLRIDTLVVQHNPPAAEAGASGLGRVFMIPSTGEPGARRVMLENLAGDGGAPEIDLKAHAMHVFAEGDADGDGDLSLDEFVARNEWMRDHSFASLDADSDGAITPAEMIAVDAHHDPATGEVHAALGQIDANHDARITRAEYEAAL